MNCNYDSCSYPGIQCKFYYIPDKTTEQNGQQPITMDLPYYEVSFMIFRTGSILIVGKCNEEILGVIYQFICRVLEMEYSTIQMGAIVAATGTTEVPLLSLGGEHDDAVASVASAATPLSSSTTTRITRKKKLYAKNNQKLYIDDPTE
jgi:hypothetical protein